jgi:D-glycero-D-manno-heptose 1,7-bisphosphate phosphatase
MRPGAFLDLNGTLVEPVQVISPEQYEPIPGCTEGIRLLNEAGYVCPVITVQGRIERGMYSEQTFLDWFTTFQVRLAEQDAHVVGPYVCPHRAGTDCVCKKPKPFLYEQAARDHDIDCELSFVVGDTGGDIQAATAIGARGCFVQTGWSAKDIPEYGSEACFIGTDILDVAGWISKERTTKAQSLPPRA